MRFGTVTNAIPFPLLVASHDSHNDCVGSASFHLLKRVRFLDSVCVTTGLHCRAHKCVFKCVPRMGGLNVHRSVVFGVNCNRLDSHRRGLLSVPSLASTPCVGDK